MDEGMDDDSGGFRACFISSPQNASYIDIEPKFSIVTYKFDSVLKPKLNPKSYTNCKVSFHLGYSQSIWKDRLVLENQKKRRKSTFLGTIISLFFS